jgi:hypothetical protein
MKEFDGMHPGSKLLGRICPLPVHWLTRTTLVAAADTCGAAAPAEAGAAATTIPATTPEAASPAAASATFIRLNLIAINPLYA